jgi:hypothetical protein
VVLVKEEDVPVVLIVKSRGEAANKEGEVVHMVFLLLLHLHLVHLLHVLLRQPPPRLQLLLWPQASAVKILQRHEHKDNFCLQCKRVPIMMHQVIVIIGMRVARIPYLQGLVNDLLVLHMFLMRLELVLMLLI